MPRPCVAARRNSGRCGSRACLSCSCVLPSSNKDGLRIPSFQKQVSPVVAGPKAPSTATIPTLGLKAFD